MSKIYDSVMQVRPMDIAEAKAGAKTLVMRYVIYHGGTKEDAEDVLQDGVLAVLTRMQRPDFELRVPPHAYLFAVCRNLWLKHLRDTKTRHELSIEGTNEPTTEPESVDIETLETQLHTWLGRLTLRCRNLLTSIYLLTEPIEQVRARLGYNKLQTLASQKYKCMETLREEATTAS